MSSELIIGIAIIGVVLFITLAIRFLNRSKEIEMTPYSNPAPIPKPQEAPKYASDVSRPIGDFRFTIQDVFTIKGRGTVVTGRVEAGTLRVGQRVRISDGTKNYETIVKDIESFRKKQASATIGDNVGLLLADLSKAEVKQGMILTSIS